MDSLKYEKKKVLFAKNSAQMKSEICGISRKGLLIYEFHMEGVC